MWAHERRVSCIEEVVKRAVITSGRPGRINRVNVAG